MPRSQELFEGAENVRKNPAFKPVPLLPYRNTSTLDNLLPAPNGNSEKDTQRKFMGIENSPIGQSESTFDKTMWLNNRKPTPQNLYAKPYERE